MCGHEAARTCLAEGALRDTDNDKRVKAGDCCRVNRVRPEIVISQLLLFLLFYYFMVYGYFE